MIVDSVRYKKSLVDLVEKSRGALKGNPNYQTVKKPERVKKIFQHSMILWDVSEQSASQKYYRIFKLPKYNHYDGNCFFQALSSVLYGHQDKHQEFRNQLVHFYFTLREYCRWKGI